MKSSNWNPEPNGVMWKKKTPTKPTTQPQSGWETLNLKLSLKIPLGMIFLSKIQKGPWFIARSCPATAAAKGRRHIQVLNPLSVLHRQVWAGNGAVGGEPGTSETSRDGADHRPDLSVPAWAVLPPTRGLCQLLWFFFIFFFLAVCRG